MPTPLPPPPAADAPAPLQRAINALLGFGRDLLGKIQAAIRLDATAALPRRFARAPQSAEQRIARTLDWIHALARTLAGDRHWLRIPTYIHPCFPGRYPALTAQLRAEIGLPPVPAPTQAQKDAAHLRYVRRVFATQPTNKIAARLARRLGIGKASDFWPGALLAITQTPAAYAANARPPPRQTPPAPEPKQAAAPSASPPPVKATGPP